MPGFDDALTGIQNRFQMLTAASPFKGQPLAGASPFTSANGMGGNSPFTQNAFGQGGSPFANAFGNVGSPFGGAFGNTSSPFANPFGQGGTAFGQPSWGNIVNPFAPKPQDADDPFGTGDGGSTTPGMGVNFTGPATADDNKTLSPEAINAYIQRTRPNSPLAGSGAFILQEANARGVSVPQLLGIMLLESQLGADGSYLPSVHNYGGLTGKSWQGQTGSTSGMAREFATFATREDGIRALIANLASPLYKGKSLQQQIGLWYLGDENAGLGTSDEHGNATMQQYLGTVASVYSALGVGYNATAKPTQVAGGGATGPRATWWQAGNQLLGKVPYQLGGRRAANGRVGPGIGIDCSEFTGWLLEQQGVKMPWNAQMQHDNTARVDKQALQSGDLVFFHSTYNAGTPVTHVGMYIGDGRFIHSGTGGVSIQNLNDSYWVQHYYGGGRVQ